MTRRPLGAAIARGLAGAGAALVAAAAAADAPADLVLRGGTLYTVATPEALAGSVAIRDGRIVYR